MVTSSNFCVTNSCGTRNIFTSTVTTFRKSAIGPGPTERSSSMKILVLNSGSSSQKSCLFELGASLPDSPPAPLWQGKIEWNGDRAVLEVRNSAGVSQREEMAA